jgi:hypothetical protein
LELIETIRVLIASMALSPPAMLISGLLEMPFRQAFSLELYYVWALELSSGQLSVEWVPAIYGFFRTATGLHVPTGTI